MTLYVSLCMCLINVYLKGLEALSANKAFCMVQISVGINHLGIIFQNLSTKFAASWHRVWLKCFQLLYVFILQCRMQIQEPCWKIIFISKEISTQTCLHIHVVRGCRTSSAVSFYNRWSWSVPWRQFGGLQSQRGLRIDILSSICILHRVVQRRGCLTDGALCRIIASRKNNKYCLHVCTLSL